MRLQRWISLALLVIFHPHAVDGSELRVLIDAKPAAEAQPGCGANKAFDQSAPRWTVRLIEQTDTATKGLAGSGTPEGLEAVTSPTKITIAGREFTGTSTATADGAVTTFDQLTFAEAANLLAVLKARRGSLPSVAGAPPISRNPSPAPPPEAQQVQSQRGVHGAEAVTGGNGPEKLDPFGDAILQLRRLGNTAGTEKPAAKREPAPPPPPAGSPAAVAQQAAAAAPESDSSPPGTPLFLVDEPCFGFSIAPIVAGAERLSNALTLRGHYAFYGDAGRLSATLAGEGQTSQSAAYFDRVEGKADFGYGRPIHIFFLKGSGQAQYAKSTDGKNTNEQWSGSLHAEVLFPAFPAPRILRLAMLEGASTRPKFTFDYGSTRAPSKRPSSTTQSHFEWTVRTSLAFSVDMLGDYATGMTELAGKDKVSYAKVQFRYNVIRDWDYVVRYECGEKEPDYKHFCGWLTGIALVTGR